MFPVLLATFKGLRRDRILQGVLATGVLFLLIPVVSTLSMRQVAALATTLSLGLYSFILLLLTVFLGATSIWKDFERRYTFSVLGLPLSRRAYLFGKFAGMAGFLVTTALILGLAVLMVIAITASFYPPAQPVAWGTVLIAQFYTLLMYLLLLGFAFLFSTVSTSFFLPVFGTIAVFLAGSVSQEMYDYLQSESGRESLTPMVQKAATAVYYILPNFGAFDLKIHAVYGLDLSVQGLLLTGFYFVVYLAIIMTLAAIVFRRRELT